MGQCTSTSSKGCKKGCNMELENYGGEVMESSPKETYIIDENKNARVEANALQFIAKLKNKVDSQVLEPKDKMGEESAMPLSYYNKTESEISSDKQIEKQEKESFELKQRVFQLENDLQILMNNISESKSSKKRKPSNTSISSINGVVFNEKQKFKKNINMKQNSDDNTSDFQNRSVESGESSREALNLNCLLSNSQVEDMCASTDFIKLFADQIENVLIDCYEANGLDFTVDFDFNLNFVSFNKKTSLSELCRNKKRIPDEIMNLNIDDVAEEYAVSVNKPIDECIETITLKLVEVREKVQKVLDELIKSLEQRINSFCEKYVKVWKEGYSLKRISHVELDFDQFIISATLRFSSSFVNIMRWAGLQGKILEGHEFVDVHEIRSRSVFVDV